MQRINTLSSATKVIDHEALRKFSYQDFPYGSMGKFTLPAIVLFNLAISISIWPDISNPHPAAGSCVDRNLLSKTRRECVKINTFHSHPHGSRETAMGAISL